MKRRRTNNDLTGGTGDINPQFIHGKLTQSAADTTTSVQYVLPVARFGTSTQKSVVVEVLKVFTEFSLFPVTAAAGETQRTVSCHFSTKFHGTVAIYAEAADVFCWDMETFTGAFTIAGTCFLLLTYFYLRLFHCFRYLLCS